jgi:pseudouridine-5'-phosphate glycosidase
MNFEKYLVIKDEVKQALLEGKPVVALESTIISHGFNYPENLDCAKTCEKIIREEGAIPATIGIRDGKILIGMSEEDILYFAQNRSIPKCSRRDVAPILALGLSGATTVATTMLFAHMAKIKVFATGGIGGVHMHGEDTMDVSADLVEIANTNVNVVCAGAKSILDLPRTKEYLETLGVSIVGYQTDAFPDFYTRDSGLKVDYRVDTTQDIAKIIHTKEELGFKAGLIIANPIPPEYEMEPTYIRSKISEALERSIKEGVKGKDVTPFLLAALHHDTEGKSVVANKALVFNNSRLAARVAKSLSEIK